VAKAKEKTRVLFIGESGLGTILYRDKTFNGLSIALKDGMNNGDNKLDAIVFAGPVLPRVPKRWSKRTEEHLAVLRTKEPDENGDSGKFKSPDDAVSYCRSELEMFLDKFKRTPIYYLLNNDTDQDNIDDRTKKLLFEEVHTKPEAAEELRAKIKRIGKRIKEGEEWLSSLRKYHAILAGDKVESLSIGEKEKEKLIKGVMDGMDKLSECKLKKEEREKLSPYIENLLNAATGSKIGEEGREKVLDAISIMIGESKLVKILKVDDVSDLEAKEIPELMGAFRQELDRLDRSFRDEEENLAERVGVLNSYLEKLRPIVDADLMDDLKGRAKVEYRENLLQKVLKRREGKGLEILLEKANEVKIGHKVFRLAHNENIMSEVTLVSDIPKREAAEKSKQSMKLGERADVSVSAHHSGGWRFYVQRKERREDDTIHYVALPTLQDIELLDDAKNKGIANIDVKRFAKSQERMYGFSSGALIIEFDGDKASYEYLGQDYLKKLGELDAKIQEKVDERSKLYSRIGKLKRKNEDPSKLIRKRDRLTKEIRNMRREFQIHLPKNYQCIHARSDEHIGSARTPEEISSRDLLRADTKYMVEMMRKGTIIDLLVDGGDQIHAVTVRGRGKVEDHSGLSKLEKEDLKYTQYGKILEAKTVKEAKQLVREFEVLDRAIDESTPIPTVKDQEHFVKRELLALPKLVMENGGYYGVTTGSHFNDMFGGELDEASHIKLLLPDKYHDQTYTFSGVRHGSGKYTIPEPHSLKKLVGKDKPGGRDIPRIDTYICHKVPSSGGGDLVLSGIKNATAANWGRFNDIGLVFVAHRHHPGGGGSKGLIVLAAAGMQPDIPLVNEINKQASVRGTMNLYMNPNKEVYKIELLDEAVLRPYLPTLEERIAEATA
jgi:hypothetical protein